MPITPLQYQIMNERTLAARKKRLALVEVEARYGAEHAAAAREVGKGGLQDQILEWCTAQWPRWKVDYARHCDKSTRPVGAHDFTVFAPGGRVLCVECKAKDGKPSKEQRVWAKELEMLGHPVHLVRSLAEFVDLASAPVKPGSEGGIKPA